MAFAEARAAWQRTANRCLVQEDAKRAPKLSCCSSVPTSLKQTDTEPPTTAPGGVHETPTTGSLPFAQPPAPPSSNLSPNSRWWLHLQPNYAGFQKCLLDEHISSPSEDNMETNEVHDDPCLIDQPTRFSSSSDNLCENFGTCDKKDFGYNKEEKVGAFPKCSSELYFDSESSWIRAERNTPWWRTADTEELAFIVAQRSLDLENCDLPRPQKTHVKAEVASIRSPGYAPSRAAHACIPGRSAVGNANPELVMSGESYFVSGAVSRLRGNPTAERNPEVHNLENDASKAQLLEALRHSQTRAREAEKAAKLASAEKEHVVKLVFRQASQIFAYKQWLHLLQLENVHFQYKNNKTRPASSTAFPVTLPLTSQKTRKTRKGWQKPSNRKRGKQSRPRCDIGKFAVVFALGLGLVGAGLLLGWTVGWILPTW